MKWTVELLTGPAERAVSGRMAMASVDVEADSIEEAVGRSWSQSCLPPRARFHCSATVEVIAPPPVQLRSA